MHNTGVMVHSEVLEIPETCDTAGSLFDVKDWHLMQRLAWSSILGTT